MGKLNIFAYPNQGQYHFYNDNEVQAYRIIGLAARGCFEMGLHRSDIVSRMFADAEEVKWAIRLFWVIYYLDRRYSFGTGMPFAMQDADIDPQLPKAVSTLFPIRCDILIV